jgi:DNA-binding CsgD family transcriptional regulator
MAGVTPLLERQTELRVLRSAVDRASDGHGSTVVVSGEAGIGKTSLIRAFLASLDGRARVLEGACDDLLTPRVLGPLRDAAQASPGPLATALDGAADPEAVFGALHEELADPRCPTLLVIEDVHWSDGATLDVLRYIGRRTENLPAVLVLTYRDDEVGRSHPLQRVLGVLGGEAVHRLSLRRLTGESVAELAAETTFDAIDLHRMTGGNPFFVTEVLASTSTEVPHTVVDAVLARVRGLSPAVQATLDQLAAVPGRVEWGLLRNLIDDVTPIADAERAGVLEVGADAVAFRHELARRAVAAALPVATRMQLHGRVLRALLEAPRPDPSRVLHHAVGAGDDEAVVRYGPTAAKEAAIAGAYRQAAVCCAEVLRRGHLLAPVRRAILTEAHAWALNNLNEQRASADQAEAAVRLWEVIGDERRLSHGLVILSRQQRATERPAAARASARRALALVEVDGDTAGHALARMNVGALDVLLDREEAGLPLVEEALAMAERVGAAELVALGHNYRGLARMQLGDAGGEEDLRHSVELARRIPDHEHVMRGLHNLVEALWRLGRFAEAEDGLGEAESYGRDRDFPLFGYMIDARRLRLRAARGDWAEAEAGLRALVADNADPGLIGHETLPALARLLVRKGDPGAEAALAAAAEHAARADVLLWLLPTGLAYIEHAWLRRRPELAGHYPELLLQRTDRPGAQRYRAELLRHLRRLGHPAEPFPGCPEAEAAGLRGDWRSAADVWGRIGRPYERALELAESGETEPTLEALAVLTKLGALPAATIVRDRLRESGARRRPRAPQPGTLANTAGLTVRQVEILRLVAQGLSNPQIAHRLVLSTRTVDHHVSAVLQKLGLTSRRDAAAALATLEPLR